MLTTTRVGRYTVKVRNPHHASIVRFSSGVHGKKERGDFLFWTAVRKDKRWTVGRAHWSLPAGDRFDRMKREMQNARTAEDRIAYARMWKEMGGGKNIAYIRPATAAEVNRWIATHESDAKFITGTMYAP